MILHCAVESEAVVTSSGRHVIDVFCKRGVVG